MLSVLLTLLLVVLVLVGLLMILIILLQRGNTQGGLGTAFGGGVADATFGAETGSLLTKGTIYLAVTFLVLSLGLYLGWVGMDARSGTGSGSDEAIGAAAAAAVAEDAPEDTLDEDGLRTILPSDIVVEPREEGADAIDDALRALEPPESSLDEVERAVREEIPAAVDAVEEAVAGESDDAESEEPSAE